MIEHAEPAPPRVDLATIVGLGLLLMPLDTMWHEIGGHALACASLGGRVAAIGAFYVDCTGLTRWPNTVVAVAGAGVDSLLAVAAWLLWRRAKGDLARLILWLVWVGKGLVATGYLCFSGIAGYGDLAPGSNGGGGLGPVPYPVAFRLGETAIGILLYTAVIRTAIRALGSMIGSGPLSRSARRRIAHGYYATAGIAAVLVGLFNPIGFAITALSAAASSFGGLAGLISVGFAERAEGSPLPFDVPRNVLLIATGLATTVAYAAVFGPTLRP